MEDKKQHGTSLFIIVLGIVALAVALFFILSDDKAPASEVDPSRAENVEQEDIAVPEVPEVVPGAPVVSGVYEEYAPEKLARASEGDVVLFFHATWCPSCRALDKSISSSRAAIPANLSILKIDYDSNSDLRKKYKVAIQHTLVQVDAEGNTITKWSGGNSLADVVSHIQ